VVEAIVALSVLWLAYNNGANDNFKGVATLYGAGVDYRRALAWASLATILGSIASVFAAKQLALVFSGSGLIPEHLLGESRTTMILALAAGTTIFLATRLGMPTSTTHALAGSLLGVAWRSSSLTSSTYEFANSIAKPLLLSPLLAVLVTAVVYYLYRRSGLGDRVTANSCVCVEQSPSLHTLVTPQGVLACSANPTMTLINGNADQCVSQGVSAPLRITAKGVSDVAHYASAGAVCFGRALNDTPKIAALLLASTGDRSASVLIVVGGAMLVGGLLHSRRVAETMSHRITSLDTGQGLCANMATSALVLLASRWGLPVSTTHVSCGALFGIGLAGGKAQWRTIAAVLLAWCTTLPLAALVSGVLFSSSEAWI